MLTIDEFAVAHDVPSRTIREYQRLELLPPPVRDGRVGRYGAEHANRLDVIRRLQERGYSLAAIGDLMRAWQSGRGLGAVLGVDALPTALDEVPTLITRDELEGLVPAFHDDDLLARALALGVVEDADGRFMARSLALIDLVVLSIGSGMPAIDAIELAGSLRAAGAAAAQELVGEFVEYLWPERGGIDLVSLLARARLTVAQATASLVVDELGRSLIANAELDHTGDLRRAVEEIRIGQVRTFADDATGP